MEEVLYMHHIWHSGRSTWNEFWHGWQPE